MEQKRQVPDGNRTYSKQLKQPKESSDIQKLKPNAALLLNEWLLTSVIAILFLCISVLPTSITFGQSASHLPDSVQQQIAQLPSDSARTRFLNQLAWNHKTNAPEYSETLLRYSIILVDKYQDCYAKADANGILGNLADNRGRFEEAITQYRKAFSMARQCNILPLQASNLNNIGLVFQRQQQYDSALIYLNQSLELKKKIGNKPSQASTLNNLGLVQYHQLNYREALSFFLESLKIKEEFNDRKTQGSTLLNISNIYKELGAKDSAFNYLERSIKFRKEFKDYLGLASSYNNLSLLHKENKQFNKALDALEEAENYANQVNDQETIVKVKNNHADVYLLLGETKLARQYGQAAFQQSRKLGYTRTSILALNHLGRIALAENKPEEAIQFLETGLELADSIKDIVGRKECLKNLVTARAKAQQQPEALATLREYQQLNDSVVYRNLAEELGAIQKSYEILKARKEANELSIENSLKDAELINAQLKEKQQIWIIAAMIAVIMLIALGLFIFLKIKKERDQQLLFAAQIEAREKERKRISSDIHDELGTHLSRIALSAETAVMLQSEKQQQQEVLQSITRLSRETITNLNDLIWYLNPDQTNLNNFFFRVREQLADYLQDLNLDYALNLELPQEIALAPELQRQLHLILKEAVHNAAKHAQASFVSVKTQLNDNLLTLVIADNGQGFHLDNLPHGNGLKNMKLRASQLGGHVEIKSEIGAGTTLQFQIPLTTNPLNK